MAASLSKKKELQRLQELVEKNGLETLTNLLKEDFQKVHVVPKEENFCIAVPRNEEVLRKCDWWELPEGLMCASCFNQTPNVYPTSKCEKRVCKACYRGYFPLTSKAHEVKLEMVRYPPFTTKGVNHVAFVGRQSRGRSLTDQSFDGLKAFARQWSNFPYRTTLIQNWVGCFGASASALATFSAMHEYLVKNANGVTYLPIYEIVERLSAFHRPGLDKITIVFYQFTSLTVKPKNWTALLSEFEKHNVVLKDVSFVSYGHVANGKEGTEFAPFVVAGDEMLRIIQERQLTDWIKSMKLACIARMFPLCPGRNKGLIEHEADEYDS